MTKECIKCKEILDISNFSYEYKNKDKRQIRCKKCHKSYVDNHYLQNKGKYAKASSDGRKRRRIWFLNIKKHYYCIKCGENNPACLDFHHRNPKDKIKEISSLLTRSNKQAILDEIKKCDALCSNCHRKYHYDNVKDLINQDYCI